MSNCLDYVKKELELIGMGENSEDINLMMHNSIIELVKVFSDQGFSGFSASYAISCLEKLLRFEPLSPLTGEDSEWNECSDGYFQNNRCSRVFKSNDRFDGKPYDIDGKVFVEHYINDEGEEGTSSYTNADSHVVVTFPYTPKTEYVDVGFRNETV